ncbi:MAG TPA: peptide-methionine (S)-S-oxide reductase [Thiolapillus brandeum]|uniref:Peptide methionine sulfoxide reductase MsrA n=1 Tax=Thiolapillus brandeum TaxID=1076588 RepID=A0A831RUG2_9GAMM|nr:peptide-methionine (S)-S-oxide reductase [Thiolapillus brandeum]
MAIESITVGGGCFWCIEAAYQDLKGVISAISGYAGGKTENPGYREVCTGSTGHAEVVQITFDNDVVDVRTLLAIFFTLHDPTTLNRQGADVGSQYRSVIFYHNEAQRNIAEDLIAQMEQENIWPDPLVTEVLPLPAFYPAEDYHQNYYRQNPGQGYCQAVISPKLKKFRDRHRALLKS